MEAPCHGVGFFNVGLSLDLLTGSLSRSFLGVLTQSSVGGGKKVTICALDAPTTVKLGSTTYTQI